MGAGLSGGGGFVGPLDAYTANLSGAWSVARRLLTSYSGSLIRIRRSSDNAEQDIGYDSGGDLDTAAIASFVGANSAYIRTIYDQNGANHAGIATAGLQPRIVSSGTLDTLTTGVPACVFDGTNDILTCANLTNQSVAAYATLVKSTGSTWNDYGSFLETATDIGNLSRLGLLSPGGTSWHVDPVVAAVRKNGTSLTGPGFNMTTINAAMCLGVNTATPSVGPFGLQMGATGVVYYLAYSLAELVAWSSVASRTAFEANQKAFIGL